MYQETFERFIKTLKQVDLWIEKAVAYAAAKSFDPSVLLTARLAPDQYHFIRQVQAACDASKFGAARLSGRDVPSNPDTEQTVDELRARIATAIAFLETFSAKDFETADDRVVQLNFLKGKGIAGRVYLLNMVIPNFYFHVTTAYAILRHNGVALGKSDYIGTFPLIDL